MTRKKAAPKRKPAKSRGGRPTRAAASAKALAALAIDPSTIDPRTILATIAADPSAAATARVAACRVLLAGTGEIAPAADSDDDEDPVTKLALKLLRGAR